MALQVGETMFRGLRDLRFEPTAKRVRALLGDETVVDSTRAVLVWEPTRVVPVYAVPEKDITADLVPVGPPVTDAPLEGPPARGPGDFGAHTTPGRPVLVRNGSGRQAMGFLPDDPALDGYVVLDFPGFDGWLEEDDPIDGHPRDPYHRVDVRRSSRAVRIEAGGSVVAESTRPRLLFETVLPVVRSYLPREDVRTDLLQPSETRTVCAYKGVARYWSLQVPGGPLERDLVWSYEDPMPEAIQIAGLMCFFDERVGVTVEGERRERPITFWSPRER
jgi:uncharacterized protein (DUF427 family)